MNPNAIVTLGPGSHTIEIGNAKKLAIIAGPCQLESRAHAFDMAGALKEACDRLGMGLIYKTSFDKANRTSASTARGIGLEKALPIFADIRKSFGVPVLTDVHERDQCAAVAQAVDVLQIPAFLSRQTDLLVAAAHTGKCINVKKGQFLSPWDMKNVIAKITEAGNANVLVTERGVSFGYNTLVSDMRALPIMRRSARRWCSMPPIRCSSPAGRATAAAATAPWCPIWRARRLRRVWPVCSWKCIRIPTVRRPMGPTWSS